MHFTDIQTIALSQWLQKDLIRICDADPKVLSDYILALLKHDAEMDGLKKSCLDALGEFIQNGECGPFIERLFGALQDQSFMFASDVPQDDLMDVEEEPLTATEERRRDYNRSPRAAPSSRNYRDREYRDQRDGHRDLRDDLDSRRRDHDYDRRDGGRRRDDGDRYHSNHHHYHLDLNDRDFDRRVEVRSRRTSPNNSSNRKRCFAFDDNGHCPRGDDCRFAHISKENFGGRGDKDDASFERGSVRGRGGTRGGRGRGGTRGGGAFPSRIHSQGAQKILVVENIPEDSLDEQVVVDYFSRFGQLANSRVDISSKSALLEFTTHEEAHGCYSSPEAIFNNRFVKVYWSSMEHIPAPPVILSPEELQANLRRMQEKKIDADKMALEKQKQLTEIQKNRAALIAKLMQEQSLVMDKLKTDTTLSVQDRAMLMKGLEGVQESIKSLMKETVNSPQVAKPFAAARPVYRPTHYQNTPVSERKFVFNPSAAPFVPASQIDHVYQTKLEAYQQLDKMVRELGDQADPQVLLEMANLKNELDQHQTMTHTPTLKPSSYKLDLRPKSFIFTQTSMDAEEGLASHYAAFAGFQGVAVVGEGVIVRFQSRAQAESAISSIPDGYLKGTWYYAEQ